MILAAAYGIFWFFFLREAEVTLSPGVMAAAEPQQELLDDTKSFDYKGYRITPLANFSIKAKILSKMTYRFGREADLSPIDLALGWGNMSDESVLETIRISQSNRFFHWRADELPIPRKEIETHASNMHLIPFDETTEAAIKRARKGEIISFSGYLVRVDGEDGWHWTSSLSRSDTGGGACELVWVKEFQVETSP
ncbi:MAG: hypothetical protein MI756_17800 [Chromatiales bacterium]|nr:hypothetical protein [Chromatiales bacterium]